MRENGHPDARLTGKGADGGLDVTAAEAVAQVKAEVVPVGAPVVQQVAGIAAVRGVAAMVFALAGFTTAAQRFATDASVALFTFDLQSEVEPVNASARALVRRVPSFVPNDWERQRITAAVALGVRDVPQVDLPRLGQRASAQKLAGWAAQIAASTTLGERGEFTAQLVLELGGGLWTHARLVLQGLVTEDGEELAHVSNEGYRVERTDVAFGCLAAEVDVFAKVVVGLAAQLSADCEASIEHLRVVTEPSQGPLKDPVERVPPPGDGLVEHVDPTYFSAVEPMLTRSGQAVWLVDPLKPAWRRARFEVREHEGMRLVSSVVENWYDDFAPGFEAVQSAVALHLPDGRDVLNDDLAKPALRDEVVSGAVLVPPGRAAFALAVLVEALTLLPTDLVARD